MWDEKELEARGQGHQSSHGSFCLRFILIILMTTAGSLGFLGGEAILPPPLGSGALHPKQSLHDIGSGFSGEVCSEEMTGGKHVD